MIESGDFPVPGAATPKNRLGVTDAAVLRKAEADFAGYRLVELQCSPVRGSFDSAHLQNIHHYLFRISMTGPASSGNQPMRISEGRSIAFLTAWHLRTTSAACLERRGPKERVLTSIKSSA